MCRTYNVGYMFNTKEYSTGIIQQQKLFRLFGYITKVSSTLNSQQELRGQGQDDPVNKLMRYAHPVKLIKGTCEYIILPYFNTKHIFAFIFYIRNPIIKEILTGNIFIKLHQINKLI